jgi:hypothetical protein
MKLKIGYIQYDILDMPEVCMEMHVFHEKIYVGHIICEYNYFYCKRVFCYGADLIKWIEDFRKKEGHVINYSAFIIGA